MTHDSGIQSEREHRLEQVLAAYLLAVEAGAPPDRQEFLARHPDLADELCQFFADRDAMQQLAGPLRAAVGVGQAAAQPSQGPRTLAEGEPSLPTPGTQVRYFGDYELLEAIAHGGMGVVFKARQ